MIRIRLSHLHPFDIQVLEICKLAQRRHHTLTEILIKYISHIRNLISETFDSCQKDLVHATCKKWKHTGNNTMETYWVPDLINAGCFSCFV